MPTPASPDDAAAGETQRRPFIPAEDFPPLLGALFPALLGALFGRPVPTETEQKPVRTWTLPPRVTREPEDAISTLHFTPRDVQSIYTYEAVNALPPGVERAAIDGAWEVAAATGQSFDSAFRAVMQMLEAPPALLAAVAGQPLVQRLDNNAQVYTWGYRPPIWDTAPPRVQIINRDGEVLHELNAAEMQFHVSRPVLTYYDEVNTFTAADWEVVRSVDLPESAYRAMTEGSWSISEAGIEYGRALAEGIARGLEQGRVLIEPTPEQRAAAAQWQRDREARAAQERADALLRSLLTPRQQRQYEATHEICVRGSDRRRYRIKPSRVYNVVELDRAGKEVASWCAAPGENLPIEDVMAAQLLWLRADAPGFRAAANRNDLTPKLGCTCYLCQKQQIQRRSSRGYRRAAAATKPARPLRFTADPLPDREPGRITRTLYDSDRVSGQWLVGGPTRWIDHP